MATATTPAGTSTPMLRERAPITSGPATKAGPHARAATTPMTRSWPALASPNNPTAGTSTNAIRVHITPANTPSAHATAASGNRRVVVRGDTSDRSLRVRLHQFDAVTERIGHVDAVEPVERLVVVHRETRGDDSSGQMAYVVDDEGGVRLGRGSEVGVDTEVDLQIAVFEPAATADREMIRLRDMRDAEHSFVEGDGFGLESGRHRQLHMIQTNDPHAAILPQQPHTHRNFWFSDAISATGLGLGWRPVRWWK